MSFNVSMLITADAAQAKRELKSAQGEVEKFGTASRSAGATAASGLKVAEAEIVQLKRSTTGVTSNLVAQFNDVGQMLAAGQSPLLLAAQQGTQISQVLGPLGARGAVEALGGAFIGMINPVNLAVFAAVAALGIFGNSLRGLVGETKTVEDALGDLEDATKSWRDAASVGLADLKRDFGSISPELVELQNRITALKLTEMLLDAASAARTLGKELNPGFFELDSRQGNIADLLGKDQFAKRTARSVTVTPEVADFERQMATLRNSSNLDEQITALERMQTLLVASAGGIGKMNEEQRVFYDQTLSIERALQAAKAAQEGVGSAQQAARNSAVDMLVSLRDEANIRQLITFHGEKSREVAEARVEAERRAFEATLQTLDVSSTLKDSLREAWDAANGMQGSAGDVAMALLDAAGAGDETKRAVADAWDLLTGAADATNVWASAMSGVAAEVRAIGSALGAIGKSGIANASKQVELEALKAGKSVADARRAAQTDEAQRDFETNQKKVGYALANAKLQEDLRGIQLDADLQAALLISTQK